MRQIRFRLRVPVTLAVTTALAIPLSLPAQAEEPKIPKGAAQGWSDTTQQQKKVSLEPSAIPAKDRAGLLGKGYEKSADTAFTTSGDGTGFHLLTADEAKGYGWKTAATLREDGFDADSWIGNACLTESGKYAAVAYAPRTFTNKPELMVRGAFAAIVDLTSGKVTKLPFTASLAYFSPGCGNGEQAVFTQLSHEGDKEQRTRLVSIDATTGKAADPVVLPGQVTSAIPTKSGIVAAHGNKLVRLNGKQETELARTSTVPSQLTADGDGGVTFIERDLDKDASKKPQARAKHLTAAKTRAGRTAPATVASGTLSEWDLTGTSSGQVFITGKAKTSGKLPARVANPGNLAKGARMSTLGHAAASTTWADGKTSLITPTEAEAVRAARTQLTVVATGKSVTLDATPAAAGKNAETGITASPALPQPKSGKGTSTAKGAQASTFSSPEGPSEGSDERYCAVARNDPKKQAFQPTPRQVEWAADQAVVGKLDFYRTAGWKNTGMGGYQPQGLFPPKVLDGDPNGKLDTEDGTSDKWHIPAQILLGITAQESNMWQATRFAVPGVTSNSLIGNNYGVQYTASGTQADPWRINWSEADCGYGITQATDGMRLAGKTKPGETALSTLTQEAVALDYTANIAYGAQILSDKWNQTNRAGMKINNGHPQWIENWFFALWAYNSGFYDTADLAGHKGVGWTNNPANPMWKANRLPFLEKAGGGDDYSHAAQPQNWPYEEKVIGWAGRPLSAMFAPGDFQAGFKPAWWNSVPFRTTAKPPVDLFCNATNSCTPGKIGDNDSNDPGLGACTLDSGDKASNPHWLHCWWNQSASWKKCVTTDGTLPQCGNAVHRFNTTYPEQPDAASYPPRCTSDLPAGALIVDDLPNGTVPAGSVSRSCGPVKSDGTFVLSYVPWDTQMDLTNDGTDNPTTVTTYPGKIDTHQIGAGYGNHFWFTHSRSPESNSADAERLKVTGTWKLNAPLTNTTRQAKIFAHIPDHGAQTTNAVYRIQAPEGEEEAVISQAANQANKWVELGAYEFGDQIPEVRLDNFNGGNGSADIAFDAVAFVPGTYEGQALTGNMKANPTAPDPAPVEPEEDITDGRFSAAPSSSARSATAAPMAATSTVTCSTVNHSLTRKRATGCIHSDYAMTEYSNTVPVGSAAFDLYMTYYLDPKRAEFSQVATIRLKSMDGSVNSATFDYAAKCRGYCDITSVDWNGSKTFAKGDTLLRTVTTRFKWAPSGTTKNSITPYLSLGGKVNSTSVVNPSEFESAKLIMRCDTEVSSAGTGCVFSGYKPTYVMNSKKFPGAAAHIDMMWRKTNIKWGQRSSGKSLTYLGNKMAVDGSGKVQSDLNRQLICGRKWKAYSGTGLFSDMWSLDAGKPITDLKSCDEFVFANAAQSAGNSAGPNPVGYSGAECIQTYLKRNADDTMTLHLRPNTPAPTWNEPCGRSSMSNWQNTQSMRPFGDFIKEQRLMEDDGYWVDLDGFTAPTP
ncbi:hypothetical protein ACFVYT_34730 [Streptomyces sp. NPDC058290]|uniref:hypothetical protein n=1 Tax=Streptomyces sp. NPDC058290 TaxID=3346426 RepID=UPI0036E5AF9A